ncbi:MAG TPA: bifunctional demethylmenaquinone methyltransferase/2-methoxy-6-polyprenyl-1,4-benzoquinol methylase UbiE [Candidatus Polarisedimenticolia bacterium]|nr:bifunctional demethylmenaquinone methyltransferase/2-methoxy-6-polyprenyl-1,4-benzoquinol methylase UbiE [Candidatus Polarisedimenticolia bacterium]
MSRAEDAAPENRYYAPGSERAEKVRLLFSTIARRYDRVNDWMSWGMHRRWKRRLVGSIAPRAGGRVLDLCCGTGDVARALAAQPGRMQVVGLDFTPEMLEVARQATPPGLAVRYEQGDALSLPFPDASFDAVTCAYGLRNLADLDRGLREAFRVLRPSGRLASLEFGRPRHPVLSWIYFAYLRMMLPLFGLIYFRDPQTYGYIFMSVSKFPDQRELAQRMRAAGFTRVEVHDVMAGAMGICIAEKAGTEDVAPAEIVPLPAPRPV